MTVKGSNKVKDEGARKLMREQATVRRTMREQFRKRRHSFLKSASALGTDCQAKVYVLIVRDDKYFTFKSQDQPSWPPCQEDIDRKTLPQNKKTAANFMEKEDAMPQIPMNPSRSIRIPPPPRLGPWPNVERDRKKLCEPRVEIEGGR